MKWHLAEFHGAFSNDQVFCIVIIFNLYSKNRTNKLQAVTDQK